MKVEAVIKVVSERYGVSEEEIVGRPGERKIGKLQQIALFLSRKETSQSLLEIAQAFNRTHASVILNVKHVARMMESDETFRNEVESIREELRAGEERLQAPQAETGVSNEISAKMTFREALNLAGWIWAFAGPLLFGMLMVATERLSHRGWDGVAQFGLFYGGQLIALAMLLCGLVFAARRSTSLASCCRSHVPGHRGGWVFVAWLVAHGLILATHPAQWGLFKTMIGRLCSM